MSEERVLAAVAAGDEPEIDRQLRPRRLDEFVGQEQVREQLAILIDAARSRGEPIEHLLLSGPPGLGKTTLAHIVAAETGVTLRVTSGPAVEFQGALASLLTSLSEGDVLFIDEVHRLQRAVEESLYPAMEEFSFDFVSGKGVGAQALRIPLQRFTVIGATTMVGMISAPLRDRFGATFRLEFYSQEELATIVRRSAGLLQVPIEDEAVGLLAARSRGTPRVANRLLRRVRDYAQVRGDGKVSPQLAQEGLHLLKVDDQGLDASDRRLLQLICEQFGGGPVGLGTLGAALAEEPHTIEEVLEPYLIQLGFLARTPRGRIATGSAYRHLGLAVPADAPGAAVAQAAELFVGED
ncbi:MAG TPA: Holliday junction branch migration DNA helicase RuvB [Candidatus Dormibacteraeota bacterium]|nr:Holliday junction branch migration DNA helicase RuvB [Candidatus Dormibacteraeota bacterium]